MDEAALLLARHQARRDQGVATVSLLAGPMASAAEAWYDWAGGRPTLTATSGARLASLFWSRLDSPAGRERAAGYVGGRPGDGEITLGLTHYDFDQWWDALIRAHDPDPAVDVARNLLSGTWYEPAGDPPGDVEPSNLLAACATLLGPDAPCALIRLPEFRADEFAFLLRVAERCPALPVGVVAARDEAERFVRQAGDSRLQAAAREGLITIRDPRVPFETAPESSVVLPHSRGAPADRVAENLARSEAERLLFERLEAEPETSGLFRLNRQMPFAHGPRPAEADLYCEAARIAVELDGSYYHLRDLACYRRDREKDRLYQSHGVMVLRFLSEDVVPGAAVIVATIREAVRQRRAGR